MSEREVVEEYFRLLMEAYFLFQRFPEFDLWPLIFLEPLADVTVEVGYRFPNIAGKVASLMCFVNAAVAHFSETYEYRRGKLAYWRL